ncbi:lysoplasmalogenase [Solimonas marina]|uniref:Lysoplasmalogenase n=1 Tax=Solimonas marina TaxID=2714601 RepID=A0A969W8Y2_9GAMM|nr:lysoplasmalogenase [Solimonas marina]NKF21121.1 lysoplasmalogenase [Solimonas marina]
MPTILIGAIVLSALAAIVADWNEGRPPIFKLLKPLTTILIGILALTAPDSLYRNVVLLALLLSLVGDVALMYESNPAFLTGLGSFLLAHLVFMLAFLHGVAQWTPPLWAAIFLLYGVVLGVILVSRAEPALRMPVVIYALVLTGMAITALLRWQGLGGGTGAYALLGATLFVLSDSALGIRKFVGRYRGAQGLILSTYWGGIACIAWSAQGVAG